MEVRTEIFEDIGEQDEQGYYEYYYRGKIFTFVHRKKGLVARQYDEEPGEAHFLHRLDGKKRNRFTVIPYDDELFNNAVVYLVNCVGVREIRILLDDGYHLLELKNFCSLENSTQLP